MNILIYYQGNHRSVFFESLVKGFSARGHNVHLLTTSPNGELHDVISELGGKVHSFAPKGSKLSLYFKHFRFLVRFCKTHKIDVVYSHLQFTNLIAVFAQRFISSKVFPCRHHADDVMLNGNKNAVRLDQMINKRARQMIVVSNAVKEHMVNNENVDPGKIKVIKLGYDFNLYPVPDQNKVGKIREQMQCTILLAVVSRMTANKNILAATQVLVDLRKKGKDVKMIIMDDGPEKQNLINFLNKAGEEQNVLFTGFVNNTIDYLKACDLILHPSLSEASNQVVREAGLVNKPSIVCAGVGDFDEYMVNEKNGFLVDKKNVVKEMAKIVERYYDRSQELDKIGANMHETVMLKFKIDPVCEQYLGLMLNSLDKYVVRKARR